MKNHFFMGYAGNKREEVETIYKNCNFDNVDTIVEPFCGSCAFSYYVSTLHPKKYTYILNDSNKFLIELFEIVRDETKLKEFEEKINEKAKKLVSKEAYNAETKNKHTSIYDWYVANKIYTIRAGLYKMNYVYKYLKIDAPIMNFLKNEKIIFTCGDGTDCLIKYKNNVKCLLFVDPPYLQSCNSYYEDLKHQKNIYEYIYDNKINKYKCKFVIVIEKMWIIVMLFKDCKNKIEYSKQYQQASHRKTTHILYKNFVEPSFTPVNN